MQPGQLVKRRLEGLATWLVYCILVGPMRSESDVLAESNVLAEKSVLAANASFYEAFAARDLGAMEALWASRAPVVCIHPGWRPLSGRDSVLASWRAILTGPAPPAITAQDAVVHVLGETAFVVCVENLPGAQLVATNVFVLEDADWKLVHHHASANGPSDVNDDEGPSGLLH